MTDSACSILCYWLFYRKMRILTNTFLSEQDKPDYILLYVVRKHVILTAAMILSTFFCLLAIILPLDSAVAAGSIDSMVNVWCLLMFDKRFDRVYLSVFGCIAKSEWNTENSKPEIKHVPSDT